jgi:transcriptional regulator with XRE-family HTH domain
MASAPPSADEVDTFARDLGARLRRVRTERHLTLHGVQLKSEGRWKAVVVGSYERGDRAISVQRLAELADFYGVPVSELLPAANAAEPAASGLPGLSRLVLNVARVQSAPDGAATLLRRYVTAILRQRHEPTGVSVSLRRTDLATLALMYDATIEELTERLVQWQVLAPESLILDASP